jgi:beta-glucosidase
MGTEHKGKGVTVQLGPVAGPIGRSPEGGRNWEGFSPDPCKWYGGFLSEVSLTLLADLTGVGIAETIKGIQDAGVIACAKHFIGNEQVR